MKRIIGIILIVVAAATGVWNFNQTQNEMELSDLALANVEALARGENGNGSMNQEYVCRKCGATFEDVSGVQKILIIAIVQQVDIHVKKVLQENNIILL